MLLEILKAIFLAGLPIAVISYYLVLLTSKNTTLVSKNSKQLKQELKTVTIENNEEDHFVKKAVQKKFLKFGGGFYGVLTFITYIHIEIMQIIDFIRSFSGFQNFIDSIGFSMIINFFLEAIMNLIQAFMWPMYWYKYLPIGSFWIWIIAALFAHTAATKYALKKSHEL